MNFRETEIAGVWVIEPAPHVDGRGHFARTFCADAFAAHGLPSAFAQCSTSYNRRRGTLRGLHFQAAPFAEAKLIRCTRGRVFDVAVDLRPASPTYRRWTAVELDAASGRQVYIPEGCAHGFQALADDSELYYQITVRYRPDAVRGLRWDDPAFAIPWPVMPPILSDRDAALPVLEAQAA
ncbi:MAG: dTDP-4-dehydrorhamnose 3,5-epimerase [Rhodospirillales bacterium]